MSQRFGASSLLLAAIALVVGLVIGGVGPRSEARGLREQLEELQKRTCEPKGAGMGREIAEVFRGRPLEAKLPEPAPPTAGVPAPAEPAPNREGGFHAEIRTGADDPTDEAGPQTPQEAAAMAREAMELRRAQARQALVEAGVSDEQMTRIDAAMDQMNDDLSALAGTFVAGFDEGQPDRREMMAFAADTLDVLIEGEDALYGVLDDDQRGSIDDAALDPFSYVDGDVVDELVKLQDR